MPPQSAAEDPKGITEADRVERLHALLREALKLVDELKLSSEIGARLQAVITETEQVQRF